MEFNDCFQLQDDDDDIKQQSDDPEVDPYRILIFDINYSILLDYRTPTFHGKELDFISFLKTCTPVKNENPESLEFSDIQIVFSLKIMNFLIDIASCNNLFCISVSIDDMNRPTMKANPLNAICVLYSIINLDISNSLNFDLIAFDDKIITNLYNAFLTLVDPNFSEYVSIVSPYEEVFCSFGKTVLSSDDYFEVWDEALAIASDLEMSDQHVLSNDTDYLAVFSFLPCIKIIVLFSEEAFNFSEPEDEKQKVITNNEMLMEPFISKINDLKSLILSLYKKDQK